MKRIDFNANDTQKIINLYTIDIVGMRSIGKLFGVSGIVVKRLLLENNIKLDTPGQRYKGGLLPTRKRYYQKHKNKLKSYYKKWASINRKKLREKHKRWRDKNKDRIRKQSRDWSRNRKNSDPIYKLNQYIRLALWQNLKESNIVKYKKTFDILPFTIEELVIHLEKLFTPKMEWNNYGEWHVDHIIPMSSFNIKSINDEEFIKCWSLSNLEPKWKTTRVIDGVTYEGNLNKGKKIPVLIETKTIDDL